MHHGIHARHCGHGGWQAQGQQAVQQRHVRVKQRRDDTFFFVAGGGQNGYGGDFGAGASRCGYLDERQARLRARPTP